MTRRGGPFVKTICTGVAGLGSHKTTNATAARAQDENSGPARPCRVAGNVRASLPTAGLERPRSSGSQPWRCFAVTPRPQNTSSIREQLQTRSVRFRGLPGAGTNHQQFRARPLARPLEPRSAESGYEQASRHRASSVVVRSRVPGADRRASHRSSIVGSVAGSPRALAAMTDRGRCPRLEAP
jgi:hypothetical protein